MADEVFGSVAPVKEVPVLEVKTPDGFVKFEFNPETKDGAGRPNERVQVLVGPMVKEFLKRNEPFFIEASDWRSIQSHAPKVFREVK
jgi:hypothetical protein